MISRSNGNNRVIIIVVVVLLVVLAGCASLDSVRGGPSDQRPAADSQDQSTRGDEQDGSTTAPPANDTGDPAAPTSRLDGDGNSTVQPVGPFPIGTSTQGITDPTALIAAHLGVLDDTSYTVTRAETHSTADYKYLMGSTLEVQGDRQRLAVEYAGQSQDIYRADNATPSFIRWQTETGVRYLRDEGDVLFPGESAFFLQSVLESSEFEFVEQRTVGDRPVFVYSITSFSESQNLRDATPLDAVDELDGTVYVRGDGLISGIDVVLTGSDYEGIVTDLEINEAFSAVGSTTVTEPPWLAEAHDRAALLSATLDQGRTAIAITMEHGDAIPAGSTGYLYLGEITLETTFEDGLEPGQSFYVFESQDGELTVTEVAPTSATIGAPVPAEIKDVSLAIFHQEYGTVYASSLPLGQSTEES